MQIAVSPLQERILAALPLSPEATIPTAKIMEGIGISNPSNADRATVSRSLARLAERGLVLRWHPAVRRPGRGNLWSRAKEQTR
jgi:DNA-binding MarR family transcriptional regulator